jgi:hypothetical protein
MMIGNVNSASAARAPAATSEVSDAAGSDRVRHRKPSATPDEGSSRVNLSKGSELVQQLSDLQKSDPAKFKLVVDDISQKFGQLAASKTGAESDGLSRIAAAFKKAADTGDLKALQPEGNRGHGTPDLKGERGQGARVAEMYRKNGPPAAPPESIEKAFSEALSIVGAAAGTQQASLSNDAVSQGVTKRTAAIGDVRPA